MIEQISFENYKLFKERQDLKLKPLTILIGKNSSGKSSITKLLPLLEYSINGQLSINEPITLENEGISLGNEFRDLLYGRYDIGALTFKLYTKRTSLEIDIASGTRMHDLPKIIEWKLYSLSKKEYYFNFQYDDITKTYSELTTPGISSPIFNGINLSTRDSTNLNIYPLNTSMLSNKGFRLSTNYIGPYRFIPSTIINLKNGQDDKMGIDGRNAYSYLIKNALYNKGETLNEISQWYQENFEGWGLNVKLDNRPNYELELIRDNPKMVINFSQVGQGMIQSLPMVLSSFIPPTSADLVNIFEQPELHLHPAAHGNLAERFASSTIGTNKRYLIETHSQNFVLRLRRMVAEGKLDKDNLIIYYVNFDEEKGESNLKEINVDKNGEVDYWPTHVFNESLSEVLAIRKAQKKSNVN